MIAQRGTEISLENNGIKKCVFCWFFWQYKWYQKNFRQFLDFYFREHKKNFKKEVFNFLIFIDNLRHFF